MVLTPTFPPTSQSTEVSSAPRVLSALRALTNPNTANLALTIHSSRRSLSLTASFAQLVLLSHSMDKKVAPLAVSLPHQSRAPNSAHALALTEFTRHSITHADARLASISRILTMSAKVHLQTPLIVSLSFWTAVTDPTK